MDEQQQEMLGMMNEQETRELLQRRGLNAEEAALVTMVFKKERDQANKKLLRYLNATTREALEMLYSHFESVPDDMLDELLATWIEHEGGGGHVRHYMLDFGDTLGSRWEVQDEMLSRRFGHSYYFDLTHILQDTFSLGLVERPWDRVSTEDHPVFGTFDVEPFDPREYKAGYPNAAFLRMDDTDGAWMARILSRFTDEMLHAMIETAEFPDRSLAPELQRILEGRRDAILDVYLTVRSPLAEPVLQDDHVCVTDLARFAGVYSHARYSALAYGVQGGPVELERSTAYGEHGLCVDLSTVPSPRDGLGTDNMGRYRVVDITAHPDGIDPLPPLRLHLYDTAEGMVLAGIERPEDGSPPLR